MERFGAFRLGRPAHPLLLQPLPPTLTRIARAPSPPPPPPLPPLPLPPPQVFEGHSHYVMALAINPKDPHTFATASLDRTVKVWSLGSPVPNFTLEGHAKGVNAVAYCPGGDRPYLISGADDRTARVWDYQTKATVTVLEGHAHNVSAVVFHPELPLIVTGSEDGAARLWHATTYRLEVRGEWRVEKRARREGEGERARPPARARVSCVFPSPHHPSSHLLSPSFLRPASPTDWSGCGPSPSRPAPTPSPWATTTAPSSRPRGGTTRWRAWTDPASWCGRARRRCGAPTCGPWGPKPWPARRTGSACPWRPRSWARRTSTRSPSPTRPTGGLWRSSAMASGVSTPPSPGGRKPTAPAWTLRGRTTPPPSRCGSRREWSSCSGGSRRPTPCAWASPRKGCTGAPSWASGPRGPSSSTTGRRGPSSSGWTSPGRRPSPGPSPDRPSPSWRRAGGTCCRTTPRPSRPPRRTAPRTRRTAWRGPSPWRTSCPTARAPPPPPGWATACCT